MAAPTSDGAYVMTQYIPAVNVNTVQQRTGPCQTPYFLPRFIKGEPKTLGAIQALIGLLHICLGGVLCSFEQTGGSIIIYSGVPFWAALFYIISGSLSISTEMSDIYGLVRGSLGMNIVSVTIAGVEIIIVTVDLGLDSSMRCDYYNETCGVHQGIVSFLLILTLLEFCIAFSTSVFGCKSVCCTETPGETQPLLDAQNYYSTAQLNPMVQTPGRPAQYMQSLIPAMHMEQGVALSRNTGTTTINHNTTIRL